MIEADANAGVELSDLRAGVLIRGSGNCTFIHPHSARRINLNSSADAAFLALGAFCTVCIRTHLPDRDQFDFCVVCGMLTTHFLQIV